MGNLENHARTELDKIGAFSKDSAYDGMLGEAVIELVKCFAAQGHSGMSASLVLSLFAKVAAFKPLTPLTGDDDEWNDVSDGDKGSMQQNNRCHHVFRRGPDGPAYDIDGLVFRDQNGATFTNSYSRTPVTFPYVPKRQIVDVFVSDRDETDEAD